MTTSGAAHEPTSGPLISFGIACYNARPYLESAVQSALAQDNVSVEILIVDDGSTDGSIEDARRLAASDNRIRFLRTSANGGPGAARNMAIENMSGEWFAVLDSDDLIDPHRSRLLLDLANESGADIVADNLRVFEESVDDHVMYHAHEEEEWYWLEIDEYFARSQLFGQTPSPGYLKPMIRRCAIERFALRYDERLRVGEDDELIVRSLIAGCRYAVSTAPMYGYRKHSNSISHRLSLDHATRMMAAEERLRNSIGPDYAGLPSYQERWNAMVRGIAFSRSIEQIKARRFFDAAKTLLRNPKALALYRMPLEARLKRIAMRR